MATIVVHTQGTVVEGRSRHLSLMTPDGVRRDIPLLSVDRLYCYGKVQVTTRAIHLLAEAGKDLVYFSMRGRYRARLIGNPCAGVQLRTRQYACAQDPCRALAMARRIIVAKIRNQAAVLTRLRRGHPAKVEEDVIYRLKLAEADAEKASSRGQLFGIEGQAAKIYFGQWAACCGASFVWAGRSARPPRDPLNILLSLGYTLLANDTHSHIIGSGLDPWLGVLHSSAPSKPALALDLMEPLRPVIVDRLVQDLCSHSRIRADHFESKPDEDDPFEDLHDEQGPLLRLSNAAFRTFFVAYEKRMQHALDGEPYGMRHLMEHEVGCFVKDLESDGVEPYHPYQLRT